MKGKYKREIDVGARAITPTLTLTPSDMFDLLQETATIHSDSLGYDMEYFKKEKKGWAILSWQAEFMRLPKWRERLTIETWPSAGRGLVANRNFRVLDGLGVPVMKVISQWCFFDNVRRRPVKISEDMIEAYASDVEDILPVMKITANNPPESKKMSGSTLVARRSHTDSNLHVNNVAYIRWAEDELPDDIFYSKDIKRVNVNYRKEARAGDKINTSLYEYGENRYVCFIKNTEAATLAEIIMEYEIEGI